MSKWSTRPQETPLQKSRKSRHSNWGKDWHSKGASQRSYGSYWSYGSYSYGPRAHSAPSVVGIIRLGLSEADEIAASFVMEKAEDTPTGLLWCPRNESFHTAENHNGPCSRQVYQVWIQEMRICSHHLVGKCIKGGSKCKFQHTDMQDINEARLFVWKAKLLGLVNATPFGHFKLNGYGSIMIHNDPYL